MAYRFQRSDTVVKGDFRRIAIGQIGRAIGEIDDDAFGTAPVAGPQKSTRVARGIIK